MMDNVHINTQNPNCWHIQGELDFETVTQSLADFRQKQQQLGLPVQIDLSQVTRTDSAGLALLVEWLKIAQQNNKLLEFLNLPEQLLHIAQVSEATELLNVA